MGVSKRVLFSDGDDDWRKEGACVGLGPEKFYKDYHTKDELAELKDLCNGCVVKEECLKHALQYEEWGVWAGTTQEQRERWRKRKNFKGKP